MLLVITSDLNINVYITRNTQTIYFMYFLKDIIKQFSVYPLHKTHTRGKLVVQHIC